MHPRRHTREEQQPLAPSRRCSRCTSASVRSTACSTPTSRSSTSCGATCRTRPVKATAAAPPVAGSTLTAEEIAQLLMQALLGGDQAMMQAMARQAVQRFAGMEPGRPVGGTYYLYRTLRNLDLDGLLEKLLEASRQSAAVSRRSRSGSSARSSRIASTSSRPRSRPRSSPSPTAGPRRWRRRCASHCPRTSSSCTPAATRCSCCASVVPADPQARRPPGASDGTGARPARLRNTMRHSLSYGGVPAEPKFKYRGRRSRD